MPDVYSRAAGDPLEATRPSVVSVTPAPVEESTGKAASQSETARKLRELNGLFKEGVITQEDFAAKKKELLRGF